MDEWDSLEGVRLEDTVNVPLMLAVHASKLEGPTCCCLRRSAKDLPQQTQLQLDPQKLSFKAEGHGH